jgi:hypothetical protein
LRRCGLVYKVLGFEIGVEQVIYSRRFEQRSLVTERIATASY